MEVSRSQTSRVGQISHSELISSDSDFWQFATKEKLNVLLQESKEKFVLVVVWFPEDSTCVLTVFHVTETMAL